MLGVGRIHPRAQEPVSSTLDRCHAAAEAEFLEKGYQGASIARAILKDASIIILDEATVSVDPENEHLIQQTISELTHGTHQELIRQNGVYKRFTEIRERAEGWNLSQKS